MSYVYTKTPVSLDRLIQEINQSSITIALDLSLTFVLGDQLTISFKADISNEEKTTLDGIVSSHSGTPLTPAPELVELDIPKDAGDKPYFNMSMTKIDWYYSPHSLDFYTSKYKSLYNRKHDGNGIDDGTDAGDAEMLFYDASGNLLTKNEGETDEQFQTRLTANCVKTIVSFEKTESFDVVGANLFIKSTPQERAYLWVIAAPDIPYEYGGSKAFMGRGMNLTMMQEKVNHYFDAKTSKTVNYDPVYHSGKIHIVVKHAVGAQIGIQLIFIMYEE